MLWCLRHQSISNCSVDFNIILNWLDKDFFALVTFIHMTKNLYFWWVIHHGVPCCPQQWAIVPWVCVNWKNGWPSNHFKTTLSWTILFYLTDILHGCEMWPYCPIASWKYMVIITFLNFIELYCFLCTGMFLSLLECMCKQVWSELYDCCCVGIHFHHIPSLNWECAWACSVIKCSPPWQMYRARN